MMVHNHAPGYDCTPDCVDVTTEPYIEESRESEEHETVTTSRHTSTWLRLLRWWVWR